MASKGNPICVVYTDTHLEKEEHVSLNVEIAKVLVKKSLSIGCDNIAHAGDVFTDRKRITLDENLLPFERVLDIFNENGLSLNVISGNHDKTSQVVCESYLDIYRHHPGIILHREPSISIKGRFAFYYVPYFLEKDGTYSSKLESRLNEIKKLRDKGIKVILITHVAVNGVLNNDGSAVEGSIEQNSFKMFDLVIVGHYHNRQVLQRNGKDWIVYIGSAFQRDFGEDDLKGFAVIYEDLSIEYHTFDSPKYVVKKFILPKDEAKLKSATILYKEKIKKSQMFVRFKIIGERKDLVGVDTEYYKSIGIDIQKETGTMLRNINLAEEGEVFNFDKSSIKKGFIEFCKENSITGEKMNFGLKRMMRHV